MDPLIKTCAQGASSLKAACLILTTCANLIFYHNICPLLYLNVQLVYSCHLSSLWWLFDLYVLTSPPNHAFNQILNLS